MSRARRPVLILGFLVVFGAVGATVIPPVAHAGPPPPSTVGPLLQTTPTSGRAAAAITAEYWFVTSGAKCTYTTVEFSWDGKLAGTAAVDPSDPRDPTYCSATQVFTQAPSTTPGGHTLTAVACRVVGGLKTCPTLTQARLTYVVTPTPTIEVVPDGGLAAAPFSATYSTGETKCTVAEAQFYWDGEPLGGLVPLDPTSCSATFDAFEAPEPNGSGSHELSAEACGRRCLPRTRAATTYTVTVPKPTATPTPSPSPSPSASPSPSPSVEPGPTPTPRPTAPPTPIPIPSGGVPGVTDPGDVPPGDANEYVPDLATWVTSPDPGGINADVVATNLLLTLLVVFLLALTAEVFNSTMDAHRDEVHGWWLRIMRGPLRVLGSLTVPGASLTRLAGSGRVGSIARVLLVLSLLGLVYSALSPDFGLNPQTLVLFVSLVVALGFLTYFSEGSTSRLAARRYRADASIRLYGTAILVSIVAVVVSRLVTFQPGLVYGFVASAVVVAPIALDRRDDATLVLVPALGLLVVSVLAWLLLGPVRVAAAGGALAPGLAETVLAMVVIGGLETLFVSMIPLRFMDGATVMGWNKAAWALAFGTVTFLWWQLLLNQDAAYVEAMEQTNVQVVLGTVVVFMLTTGGLWSYFRFRPSRAEAGA